MKRLLLIALSLAGIVALLAGYVLFTRSGQDMALERMVSLAVAPADDAPVDGLRVFMCGTSSPLPAPDRAQACVAVMAGDQLYLVDAGAGSARTALLGRLPLQNLQAILLTHFHSDHIAAIGDFNLNSWVAGRPQPLQIAGPVGVERVVEGFNIAYELDRGYRVAHHGAELLPPELGLLQARTLESGVVVDTDGLVITMFDVNHSPVTPAVGYRFDYRGRSVVVSGDTIVTTRLRDAARGADLLLQDGISLPIVTSLERASHRAGTTRIATILHDIQDYHADNARLAQLVEDSGVRMLALYHLVPPPRNLLMQQIYSRDLPPDAVITTDGMWFELPADSEEILIY